MESAPRSRDTKTGKERILDAAEQLFAQHGFDGVSVRAITEAALVDVALVSYHFGGKRELFASLFQRRAEHLNAQRTRCLEEAIAAARPGTPSIEVVLDCYLRPMWQLAATGDPGWAYFFQIIAQVNNSPRWAPILMSQHFDASAQRMLELIRAELPGAPAEEIYWAIFFVAASLTMASAQTGRIDRLSGGICTSADLQAAFRRLVVFATAGIHALARPPAETAARSSSAKVLKSTPKRLQKTQTTSNGRKKRL